MMNERVVIDDLQLCPDCGEPLDWDEQAKVYACSECGWTSKDKHIEMPRLD